MRSKSGTTVQQFRRDVETHQCVDPTEINQDDINEVERMLSSHTWKITSIDHEQAKISIKYACAKCGTQRLAFAEWIPKS